jgi:hypothetical protein
MTGDDTVQFLNALSGGELDTLTNNYFSTNGIASRSATPTSIT